MDEAVLAERLALAVGAVDAQMSNWKADSDLSRLNRAAPGGWVPVSGTSRPACAGAEDRCDTHNAFNIGVGDLVDRWGFGPSGATRFAPRSR
jgi:thiamine biosynthesis lipoprotein